MQILDLEQRLSRLRRRLVDAEEHLASDHQPRQALLGGAGRRKGLDRLAKKISKS